VGAPIVSAKKFERKYNPITLQQLLRGLEDVEHPPLCERFCANFGTPACTCFGTGVLPEAGYCKPGFQIKTHSESELVVLLQEVAQH